MVTAGRYVAAAVVCVSLLTGCALFEDDILRDTAADGRDGDFRADRYAPATRGVVRCRDGREQAGRWIGYTARRDGYASAEYAHADLCPIATPPEESRWNVAEVESGDGETFRVYATVNGDTPASGWPALPSLHLECDGIGDTRQVVALLRYVIPQHGLTGTWEGHYDADWITGEDPKIVTWVASSIEGEALWLDAGDSERLLRDVKRAAPSQESNGSAVMVFNVNGQEVEINIFGWETAIRVLGADC